MTANPERSGVRGTRVCRAVQRNVSDLDRVRDVREVAIFQIDRDDQSEFGAAGFREVRPQLEQVERGGWAGRRMPAIELSEAAHLLQKF